MTKHTESEAWRPVVGYDGIYEVSSLGRVRSLPRISASGNRLQGRMLKRVPTPKGYEIVTLTKNGCQKVRSVHTLVLEAFVGPRPSGHVACHYDDVPTNNRVDNLRWGTYEDNAADRRRNLGVYLPQGTSPSSAARDERRRQEQAVSTHCKNGHAFTEGNTYVSPAGYRQCRTCKREGVARHYRANHAAELEKRAQWRDANREKYRAAAREYRKRKLSA